MRISDWSSDVCSSDLLPAPAREGSGYRRYESHDVSRLHFVRRAKALGFTLGEIRELLALSTPRHGDMAAIKAAACDKLADVERRLAELTRVRDGLRTLVDACPGHGELEDRKSTRLNSSH